MPSTTPCRLGAARGREREGTPRRFGRADAEDSRPGQEQRAAERWRRCSASLATLEGTLTQLAPGFDLVAESRAFAAEELAERLRPEALRRAATDEFLSLLPLLRRVPRRRERIGAALQEGRFAVDVRLFADDRDRRVVTGLVHQVLLAGLAAATGIMAVLKLGLPGGPSVTGRVSLFQLLGYGLLVVSAVLGLRVLVAVFRPDRR